MKMPWSKPAPDASGATPVAPATPVVDERRDATAPKGRPTPKQHKGRGPVAPPPSTGKEARQRMRERERERKAAGMPPEKRELSPREERMQARDAGPERELVRNIVDTRRTISSIFPLFAVLILVAMFGGLPTKNPQLYAYISYAWIAFFFLIVIEMFFLSRVIGTAIRERFPKTQLRMGSLKYYGIIRALMIRKFRYPKPVKSPGDSY